MFFFGISCKKISIFVTLLVIGNPTNFQHIDELGSSGVCWLDMGRAGHPILIHFVRNNYGTQRKRRQTTCHISQFCWIGKRTVLGRMTAPTEYNMQLQLQHGRKEREHSRNDKHFVIWDSWDRTSDHGGMKFYRCLASSEASQNQN